MWQGPRWKAMVGRRVQSWLFLNYLQTFLLPSYSVKGTLLGRNPLDGNVFLGQIPSQAIL